MTRLPRSCFREIAGIDAKQHRSEDGTLSLLYNLLGCHILYGKKKIGALPGNRTRIARMGILHDTTTPAVLLYGLLLSSLSPFEIISIRRFIVSLIML